MLGLGFSIPQVALAQGKGAAGQDVSAFRAFSDTLADAAADVSLLWLGTSIGNEGDEHVRHLDANLAAAFPAYSVDHMLYSSPGNPTAGTWEPAALTVAPTGAELFSDNFNRADGAIGTSSGGGSYNTATSWVISGNGLTCVSGSNNLNPAVAPASGNLIMAVDYVHGSDTALANGTRLHGRYLSASANVYLGIKHNGAFDLVYAAGAVNIASISIGRSLVAGEAIHARLTVVGRWLRGDVTIGGTTHTVTGRLSAAQDAALTGTKWVLAAPGSVYTGKRWDNLSVTSVVQTRRLSVHNACVAGASISYMRTNLASIAAELPGAPGLIIVDAGYNEGNADVPTFWSRLDGLRADLEALYPTSSVAMLMEMPVGPAAANVAYHGPRVLSIPDYCRAAGMSWIDGWSGYDLAWTDGDDIHPGPVGSAWIAARDAAAFGIP